MYTVVAFVLPFLVLSVFSVLLIRVYRAQRRRRAALMMSRGVRNTASTTSATSTNASNEHSVTRIIVVVMVVFLVCNLPAKVFDNVYNDRPSCGTFLYVARRLSFVLEIANSAANFVVYCALRHQFRDGLCRVLHPLQNRCNRRRSRRQLLDDDGGGVRQRSLGRTRSEPPPVDLECLQTVTNLQRDVDGGVQLTPRRDLDVPGISLDRNTA